ncbi:MAG TPA: DUF4199 domain-containing protein [Thermoanaerobaculia bacterium]
MKKIVLTFGIISGCILALMMAIMMPLVMSGTVDLDQSEVVGYTSMVLAFVMVFVGIRSYRENIGGGVITFGRAFKVGILISLIACAFYVVSWQIIYYGFIPDFETKYAARVVEKLKAEGAAPAQVAAKEQEMAEFSRWYKNPLVNVGFTFLEVFPVGLVGTLVSAGILRRKPGSGPASGATAIA